MAKYRSALLQLEGGIFLSYCGMETDLIFNRGVDLPGFASYPLLETEEGRKTLRGYYAQLIDIARQNGVGFFLESTTWVADRDISCYGKNRYSFFYTSNRMNCH